eukprot:9230609-Pyramimonas_sp.AAC.2
MYVNPGRPRIWRPSSKVLICLLNRGLRHAASRAHGAARRSRRARAGRSADALQRQPCMV